MRRAAADDDVEVAAALAFAGKVAVGEGRLVDQAEVVALRRLGQQRCGRLRADLLVGIEQHFPADAFAPGAVAPGGERQPHRQQAALEVGHAGAVQLSSTGSAHAGTACSAPNTVSRWPQRKMQRRVGTLAEAQRRPTGARAASRRRRWSGTARGRCVRPAARAARTAPPCAATALTPSTLKLPELMLDKRSSSSSQRGRLLVDPVQRARQSFMRSCTPKHRVPAVEFLRSENEVVWDNTGLRPGYLWLRCRTRRADISWRCRCSVTPGLLRLGNGCGNNPRSTRFSSAASCAWGWKRATCRSRCATTTAI